MKYIQAIKQNKVAYLFLLPAMLVMLCLVFIPLVQGIYYSLTNIDQYNMGNRFVKASYRFIGLQNYISIFSGEGFAEFSKVFRQTLIWTFVNVFFHFVIGLGLALLLNRHVRGRAIYRTLLLIPWAVPSFVSAFAWRWMFNGQYGFINLMLAKLGLQPIPWLSDPFWAMTAVIITNIWLGFPFMMVTMLGGLQSISKELYEAAYVDGANRIQQFFRITLPQLRPTIFVATLLGVIWTFNMFAVIYLITEGGPYNSTQILVTYAYNKAFSSWQLGEATTYGVIILSMLLAFSFFYTRLLKMEKEQ
ncbi:carbohydrate ABC transporter permease [Effusibacillus pohliae]|uniref:carbohydrate ABC transporter permease n=1 Tax=Effusibacillus pohliae TaxID=232270 RepID=UPI00037E6E11|nr:sugar ABC transporter permease [Effusibacillus pohliae]